METIVSKRKHNVDAGTKLKGDPYKGGADWLSLNGNERVALFFDELTDLGNFMTGVDSYQK